MSGYGQAFTQPIIARVGSRVINKISRKPIFWWFSYQCIKKVRLRQKKTRRLASESFKILIGYIISASNQHSTCCLVAVQEVLAREEKFDRQIGSKKADCTIHFEIAHCGLNLFAQTQESFS